MLIIVYRLTKREYSYEVYNYPYSGCYCFSHSFTYFHSLVHRCDQDNGGCEDKCVKKGANFSCACNATGKVLGEDQKSCVKG